MTCTRNICLAAAASIVMAACSSGKNGEQVAAVETTDGIEQVARQKNSEGSGIPAKAGSPFSISYELIGTPIVGSPLTLNLTIASAFGPTPVEIRYRVNDSTALMLHEAQPESLQAEMTLNETSIEDRVTVIPQREGRVYLNVEAGVETTEGRISTTMAIPIHVGAVDTSLVEHGELETNEEGETTRVLTSE
ncbi:MAG: hypothetical protein WBM45_07135 [Woeseiaceae bacterium]